MFPFGERQRQTKRQNMNIFDDVKLGLEQAIEYEQGKTEATERVLTDEK